MIMPSSPPTFQGLEKASVLVTASSHSVFVLMERAEPLSSQVASARAAMCRVVQPPAQSKQ